MKKVLYIITALLIMSIYLSGKFFINNSDSEYMISTRELLYLKKGDRISISDQMFKPPNMRYPEQLNHFFERDSLYRIVRDSLDPKKRRIFIVVKENDNIERKISLESIRYPKHLLFSNSKCLVKTDSLEDNGKYVFFEKEKLYPFRKKDSFTFIVLDDKRNQVFIAKNKISF